jgi:hypothetical protein
MFWQKCAGIGNKHKVITLSRCWHSSQRHWAPNMCRWPGSWNNRTSELSYIVNWRSVHFTIVLVIITRLMGKKTLRGNNYCRTPLLANYKTKSSINPSLFIQNAAELSSSVQLDDIQHFLNSRKLINQPRTSLYLRNQNGQHHHRKT